MGSDPKVALGEINFADATIKRYVVDETSLRLEIVLWNDWCCVIECDHLCAIKDSGSRELSSGGVLPALSNWGREQLAQHFTGAPPAGAYELALIDTDDETCFAVVGIGSLIAHLSHP
jgi:hypothetical protein